MRIVLFRPENSPKTCPRCSNVGFFVTADQTKKGVRTIITVCPCTHVVKLKL